MKEQWLGLLMRLGFLRPDKIMYIGGSDILPTPLKGVEEQKLLDRLAEGDEEAKAVLIERNLSLIHISREAEEVQTHMCRLEKMGKDLIK